MKTFLLVLCIFVATAYGGPGFRKNPNFDACLAENEVSKEQFQTLRKSGDPKVGCVFACLMTKEGTMTDSTIDVEKIKERLAALSKNDPKFNAEKSTEIATSCASEVQSMGDKCEKVLAYKKCFHSKMRADNKNAQEQQPSE